MARLRESSAPALVVNRDDELKQIRSWYEDWLPRVTPPKGLEWDPVRIGPVWDWAPGRGWNLPEYSLGWDVMAWCGFWLNGPGGDPWRFTAEQARAVLWFYAVEPGGGFTFDHHVVQRLKGWGKDPLAATLVAASMVGPVVPEWDGGRLVGREEPDAWVQILAVSLEQTKNTMKLFPGLISREARDWYGFQIGKRNLWALNDTRQAEAVTSSADSIEGARPTLLVANETQNWTASNGGHDMMGAIEGNAAKAKKGRPARQLSICNAYVPGRDSVAQRVREAWEATQGDSATHSEFGLLYDSLEAPPEAPLTQDAAPSVVRAVRGDAVWLDADDRILKSILNPANPPSESRRKWYNQITADEDSWVEPREIDPLADTGKVLDPADEVVVFFDGSKTDDATAAVYCRVSDGHCGVVGMWQRPPMNRIGEWVVPRAEVDATITEFVDSHNVVALFADPSHAREDETLVLFWDSLLDEWHERWKRKFRLWARPGRDRGHATLFDMSDSKNLRRFVDQVGITTQEIMSANESSPELSWDGDIRLRTHMLNAKRVPSRWGMSLGKNNRKSQRKIDLAVCLVGARMVRREYLLRGQKRRGGRIG